MRLDETGEPVDLLVLQDLDGQQGHQAHQRPGLEARRAVAQGHLVVVETVLVVPQARAAQAVHRLRDAHEVVEELRGQVLVRGLFLRQFQGHGHHGAAVEGHPGGGIRLLQALARGQRLVAVEEADVVHPQEPAREDLPPREVLAVHPPREVEEQLLERPLQEQPVAFAVRRRDLVHAPAGPRMDGRVDVGERELARRQLAAGVHEPLAQEQHQLLLGELRVHPRHRHHLQAPGPTRRTTGTPTCRASRWRCG